MIADRTFKAECIKSVTIIPGTFKYSISPAKAGWMHYTDRTFAHTDVPEKLKGIINSIDNCSRNGGGVVLFFWGNFGTGTIVFHLFIFCFYWSDGTPK